MTLKIIILPWIGFIWFDNSYSPADTGKNSAKCGNGLEFCVNEAFIM